MCVCVAKGVFSWVRKLRKLVKLEISVRKQNMRIFSYVTYFLMTVSTNKVLVLIK